MHDNMATPSPTMAPTMGPHCPKPTHTVDKYATMSKRPASSADDKQPKRAKKDETDTTATLGQSAVRALAAELQAGVSHVERCLGLLASGHTVPFIARYRAHETGGMEPPLPAPCRCCCCCCCC